MAYGHYPAPPKEKTSKAYPAPQDALCAYGDTIDKGEMIVHNPENPNEIAHLQCILDRNELEVPQ